MNYMIKALAVMLLAIVFFTAQWGTESAIAQTDTCQVGTHADGYWRYTALNFVTGSIRSTNYRDPGIDDCKGKSGVLAQIDDERLLFQRQICKSGKCSQPSLWAPSYSAGIFNDQSSGGNSGFGEGTFTQRVDSMSSGTTGTESVTVLVTYDLSEQGDIVKSSQFNFPDQFAEDVYDSLDVGRNFYAMRTTCTSTNREDWLHCGTGASVRVTSLKPDSTARPAKIPQFVVVPEDMALHIGAMDYFDPSVDRLSWRYRTSETSSMDAGNWSSWRNVTPNLQSDGEGLDCGTVRCHWWILRGLQNGVSYDVQMKARNADGESSTEREVNGETVPRNVVSQTPALPAPPTPSGLRISDTGISVVTITWDRMETPRINGYQFAYQRTGQSGTPSYQQMPGSSQSTTSYTIIGLSSSTSYDIYLRAVNDTGVSAEAASREARTLFRAFTPSPPSPPPPVSNPTPSSGFSQYCTSLQATTWCLPVWNKYNGETCRPRRVQQGSNFRWVTDTYPNCQAGAYPNTREHWHRHSGSPDLLHEHRFDTTGAVTDKPRHRH